MNDLSLLLPTAQTIAVSAYIDFIPHLQYSKPLGSSRFSKTIKCLSTSGSVVVKLLIKPTNHQIDLSAPLKAYEELRKKLEDVPNVLAFTEIIDSDRASYLIRDFVRYNLYERLSVRPFLESIEKKWIVYQLLHALAKIHEKDICHGDIKSENVLLTSWSWVLLTDFAHLKPIYLPDYNQSQFSFYFDISNRHSCYIAPERFKNKQELDQLSVKTNHQLKPEMDIFSLGCVIAELYTDGIPCFSLPQMFKYRKGEYTPNLDAIDDIHIKKLIQSMINVDPKQRLSAKQCLINFRKMIFPDHFYTFLHSYIKSLNIDQNLKNQKLNDKFHLCNLRIDKIWSDFDKIALYLGFKGTIMKFDSQRDPNENNDSIIPIELNLPGMKRHIPQNTSKIFTETSNNDCSSLIFLSIIMYNVRNTTHSAYRSKACDLILAFAEQLPDEAKLDRCLPYLANMLDDPNEDLQTVALKSVTQLLLMVDTITPINVYLFPEYLLPKIHLLLKRSYTDFSRENSTANISKIYLETSASTISDNKLEAYSNGSFIRMVFACCLPYLASTAKRFYQLSKLLKKNLSTFHDPDMDSSLTLNKSAFFDFDYDDLEDQFEQLTRQILTDNDSHVKISLMNNIVPLCSFFNKDKINDVILSHLITYLNDRQSQLKLGFIQCILPLSIFVGPTSIEQYILPLLFQALFDPDELIVIELLSTLKKFVDLGMIRKEFYWDLIDLTIKLTLHPNEQMRESIINLILSIGNRLSLAELYCMMYPLIRPYFQHEINDFTWENLYLTLHKPLSRGIFNIAKMWSLTKEQTLFWQRVSTRENGRRMDSFGNTKLTFLKKQRGANTMNKSSLLAAVNDVVLNSEVPLNKEDKKQIDNLISHGLEEAELWKLATLRSYIFRVVRLETGTTKYTTFWDQKLNLLARSVFVDVKYEFEEEPATALGSSNIKKIEHKSPPLLGNTKPIDEVAANNTSPALLLPNLKQTKPLIGEIKAIAMGETSSVFSGSGMIRRYPPPFEGLGDTNIYDETLNQKNLITKVHYSYPGQNPFILKFLDSISFAPDLDIYTEFGPRVKSVTLAHKEPHIGQGKSIGDLREHTGSITCIAISPDHRYFITGDDEGFIKIWESVRLELDVSGNSFLSVNLGSSVKDIAFIPERSCFGVCTIDGSVKIFRVNFVDSLNKKRTERFKETSISLIRTTKLKKSEMFATKLQFSILKDKPYLFVITSSGRIIIFDVRMMAEVQSLQNDVMHGVPLSLALDEKQNWMIVGTTKGVLDLWDIEAGLCIKSVKFKTSSFPITKLENLGGDFELYGIKNQIVAFVGGTGQSDVIIWDVGRMIPRLVLCSEDVQMDSPIESYVVEDVDYELSNKIYDLWINNEPIDKSSSSLTLTVDGKLISSCYDTRIIEWDLQNVEMSKCVVNPMEDSKRQPVYSESAVSSTLSFVTERYVENKTSSNSMSKEISQLKRGVVNDKVNVLAKLFYPFEMVLSGDRNGVIRIYK